MTQGLGRRAPVFTTERHAAAASRTMDAWPGAWLIRARRALSPYPPSRPAPLARAGGAGTALRLMLVVLVLSLSSLLPAPTAAAATPGDTATADTSRARGALTVELPGGVDLEFLWIAPGTFRMGSPAGERGGQRDEKPQHAVTISNGFYLGRYELTQAQWEAVMGTRPWEGKKWVRADPRRPAVYVSCVDALALIHVLNQAAGDSLYRLPTEAEWEYACRAGTTSRWSFGDDESLLADFAWYRDNTGAKLCAQRVGSRRANPWGLYDMHGNVWEWCRDWHAKYDTCAQVDPAGPPERHHRIMRGGSFFSQWRFHTDPALTTRSAHRGNYLPTLGFAALGIRLLRIR